MKCWKVTNLTSMSCHPVKHGITLPCKICNFSQQAIQRPTWLSLHSRDKVLTLLSLQCDLCSQDSYFSVHYSWNNTVYIPPRAREAMTGSHRICFLSHNNKLSKKCQARTHNKYRQIILYLIFYFGTSQDKPTR